MLYELELIGGPHDGETSWSPRPMDCLHLLADNTVYRAEQEGEACLEWVGDRTRRITLYFAGYFPDCEFP